MGRLDRKVRPGTLSALRAVSWYWKTLMGDNHYQRYVEHHERVHPGEPVMSESAYWRHRHAEADANPSARCC